LVVKQRAELLEKLTLTVVLEDDSLSSLDNGETLIEGRASILATHVGLEFRELA